MDEQPIEKRHQDRIPHSEVSGEAQKRLVIADVYQTNDNVAKGSDADLLTLPNGVRVRRGAQQRRVMETNPEEQDETYDYIAQPSKATKATQTDSHNLELIKVASISDNARLVRNSYNLIGVVAMMIMGYYWSLYLSTLHENHFWFSNIREVEREISFRTEQGLYYSFYKQLVNSESLFEGIIGLANDNCTEHGHVINVWRRFNIVQELFLATLHRLLHTDSASAIFFYVNSVFNLQILSICAIFAISWILGKNWLCGLAASALFFCHRNELTRVEFTPPLREHFAIPFVFVQCLSVGRMLNNDSKVFWLTTALSTIEIIVTWQFSQFVLVLQVALLLALALLRVTEVDRVLNVLYLLGLSLLVGWFMLCCQWMVINSLVCSLIPVAILALKHTDLEDNNNGLTTNLVRVVGVFGGSVIIAIAFNTALKFLLGQDADSHIFKFVLSKLISFESNVDFETRLYACLPIFQPLQKSYFALWSSSGAMPSYVAVIVFFGSMAASNIVERLGNNKETAKTQLELFAAEQNVEPELVFHIGMASAMQLLAFSASRLKCLWSPYVAALCPLLLSRVLPALLPRLPYSRLLSSLALISVVGLWYAWFAPGIRAELEDLREFYDPDTVDLMEFFQTSTQPWEAVTGSMQLMAAVKLCTSRPVANHPHFEDKRLRERTRQLYDIYSRKSVDEVYEQLKNFDVSYVVLEDSLCLSKSHNRCHLPAIVDLVNNHVPDDGRLEPAHLVRAKHERFCEAVRDELKAGHKFKLVFANNTFRVYKLIAT